MVEAIELQQTSDWPSMQEGKPKGFLKPTHFDKVWDVCQKEFEFLKTASYSDHLAENCISVMTGVGVGLLCFCTLGQFGAVTSLLGGAQSGTMSPISMAINLARLPLNLSSAVIKVGFFAFMSFVTPYAEEFAFRGLLHEYLSKDTVTKIDKVFSVLKNAFLFALYHIPALLPHVSILLLLELFILGAVFATLRVCTDNRVASTAAHVTYNSLVFGTIFALA